MQFYLIFNSSILPVLIKLFCPTGKCNEKVWSHISSIIPTSKYSFRLVFLAVVFRVEIPRSNLLKTWRDFQDFHLFPMLLNSSNFFLWILSNSRAFSSVQWLYYLYEDTFLICIKNFV